MQKAGKEVIKETGEAVGKKTAKEILEALAKKEGDDIAAVVTKTIDDKIDDAISKFDSSTATTAQKGNFGEMVADKDLISKGYDTGCPTVLIG